MEWKRVPFLSVLNLNLGPTSWNFWDWRVWDWSQIEIGCGLILGMELSSSTYFTCHSCSSLSSPICSLQPTGELMRDTIWDLQMVKEMILMKLNPLSHINKERNLWPEENTLKQSSWSIKEKKNMTIFQNNLSDTDESALSFPLPWFLSGII